MLIRHGKSLENEPRCGFDFTSATRRLCDDIVVRLPEFSHIDLDRVAFSFCQARKRVAHGLLASLTPLRFQNGATSVVRRGIRYACQPVVNSHGGEYLYILNFYLPRFLDRSLPEKLSTVVHELWHIGPKFDGDLRRHAGRCYAHGSSQRKYNAQMDALAERWLAFAPPSHLYQFMELSFRQLANQFGGVYGVHVPAPKLLRVEAA